MPEQAQLIVDTSCKECFNASVYPEVFEQALSLKIKNVKTVDTNSTSGKTLVSKYNIEMVPTIILSKDASLYPVMEQVWPQLGTQEKDGSYVLRNVGLLGSALQQKISYKNLSSGEVIGSSEAEISAPENES